MDEDPAAVDAPHKGMVEIESMQPVLEIFPFRSTLGEIEVDKDQVFVVHVGGGRGNALGAIMADGGVLMITCEVLAIYHTSNMLRAVFTTKIPNAHEVLQGYLEDESEIIGPTALWT